MKRMISFFLALSLLVCISPAIAFPVKAQELENLEFKPIWPTDAYHIRVLDHYSWGEQHRGIDIGAAMGTNVYAVADGVVEFIYKECKHTDDPNDKCGDTWGNYVLLSHTINGNTYYSRYAHLSYNSITVKNGDTVDAGDIIGLSGSSGASSGAHLHLELYKGSRTREKASKSFQYYFNNPSVINGVTFASHIPSSSEYWGDWVAENCELVGDRYVYSTFEYRNRLDCDLTFEIDTASHAWTMPGSNETYPDSEHIGDAKIPKGTQLHATAIYENAVEGHYWYETEYAGETAYVYVPHTSHVKNNWGVSVSDVKKPSKIDLGDGFGLRGIVNTDGSIIQSIRGYVYAGNATSGTPVVQSDKVTPNSKSYNIKNEINNTLLFDEIDKAGYYTYVVKAVLSTWCFENSSTPVQVKSGELVLTDTQAYFTVGNPSSNNDHIEETFYCYGELTVTADETWVKTLPCSSGTDALSGDVENKAASPGDTYTAVQLILNDRGNYWYKVQTDSGAIGYVYAGDVSFEQKSDLTLTGVTYPIEHEQGKSFPVKGIVSTTYQKITAIHVYVSRRVDSSPATGVSVDVNVTQYDLSDPAVDYQVKFDDLPAGEYTYQISARIETYYATGGKTRSTTYTTIDLHWTRFTVVSEDSCSHSYMSVVTQPTCTEQGYTTYTCTKCGYSYISDYAIALGHNYTLTECREETCETDGFDMYACSRCGNEEIYTYPSTGHYYDEEFVEATCQEMAKYVYTCQYCEDSYEQHISPPGGEWSTTKPEGVDEDLIESRMEYRYKVKEFTTSADSTLEGWVNCDSQSAWGEYGAWSEWTDTAIAASDAVQVETRIVYGYYYYLCPSCGAHMHGYGTNACYTWAGGCGGSIPNTFYKVWSTVTWDEANFQDWHGTGKYYTYIDGELVFKWTGGSGKTQYRSRTRELETVYYFYRWSEWSDWTENVTVANDVTSVETRTVYRSLANGLGEHDYIAVVTPPTCSSSGYTTHTCGVCGDSYVDNYVDAGRHEYENGNCIHCGEADPNQVALKGDLDLDGDVDAEDLTILARHVAGIEILTDTTALANADVDGDGDIDANDLTMHARFVAGIITDWEAAG